MSAPCTVCGSLAVLHCSRCLTTPYCGPVCQHTHWKTHKPLCVSAAVPATPVAPAVHPIVDRLRLLRVMDDNFCEHSSSRDDEEAMNLFARCYDGYTLETTTNRVHVSHKVLYDIRVFAEFYRQHDKLKITPPTTPDSAETAAMRAASAEDLELVIAHINTTIKTRFLKTWENVRGNVDSFTASLDAFCQLWQGFTLASEGELQVISARWSIDLYLVVRGMVESKDSITLTPPATADTVPMVRVRHAAYRYLRLLHR